MAPAARRDRAETSEGRKPRVGPRWRTAPLNASDMSVGVTHPQLCPLWYAASNRFGAAPAWRRWSTRRTNAAVGQTTGSVEAP